MAVVFFLLIWCVSWVSFCFLGLTAAGIGNRVKVNVWIEKIGSLVGGMNLFSDLVGSCYCCLFSLVEFYAFYSFLRFYGYWAGEYGDNGRFGLRKLGTWRGWNELR